MRRFSLSVLVLSLAACACGSEADSGASVSASGGNSSSVGGASAAGGSTSGGAPPSGGASGATTGGASSGGTSGGASSGGEPSTGGTPWAESPGGMAGAPPETWTEHWFEHDQTVKLVDSNEWVVLYADDAVDRDELGWIVPAYTEVWRYTVTHYGQFTDGTRDGRLYLICHQGKYSGGHPSTYFDASHDYRNVSDVGPGPWPDGSLGIHTHEVSHIVELASRGVHGSPAFGLWGDSKWAEFFIYDVYKGLGWDDEAAKVFDDFTAKSDSFPQADTFWFRDWFYPLWRDHGGVQLMANYFKLLADHFPQSGSNFDGSLNFGEYIHFMSGAAGTSLKPQATTAFGWNDAREAELVAAQTKFSAITY